MIFESLERDLSNDVLKFLFDLDHNLSFFALGAWAYNPWYLAEIGIYFSTAINFSSDDPI